MMKAYILLDVLISENIVLCTLADTSIARYRLTCDSTFMFQLVFAGAHLPMDISNSKLSFISMQDNRYDSVVI